MKNLGISFSGGGARAISFLGFLRGLEANGIRPQHITSYSGGSWLLSALTGKLSDDEFLNTFANFRFWKMMSLNPIGNRGFIKFNKFYETLRKMSHGSNIEDLEYEASIAYTDVTDPYEPKLIVQEQGELAKYSAISSIITPIFPLFKENGRLYADGGYSTGYNSEYLMKKGMDVIIGFNAGSLLQNQWIGIVDGVARITRAVMTMRERLELEKFPITLLVNKFEVEGGITAFYKAKELFEEGYKLAESRVDEVKELLK